ncbi:LysM domain/BON superfamily protein [Rubripirellula amarantea]|uniref:LysM domain/BON superfamily protein n=2 Tax=Rubripirellula amarantea TaxID=2527999 RepID=A0A5C5WQI6_9BACT|nr:LysM domain/BON superfamily protein [Rubripirellula amarantea]
MELGLQGGILMRRKYFGIAIAALATLGPMQAWGGDREIAEQIIQRLKSNRDSGALKDFNLDMKVDDGVVLLRGKVAADVQKELVLAAANGIEGITKVVDEVSVIAASQPTTVATNSATAASELTEMITAAKPTAAPLLVVEEQPEVMTPAPVAELATTDVTPQNGSFSFAEALASEAKIVRETVRQPLEVMPGVIQPAAALEESSDDEIVSSVVSALGRAKDAGKLKGFGVDVQCENGTLALTGRASSAQQRNAILNIASQIPGVNGVREAISIPAASNLARLPEAISAPAVAEPMQNVPARLASAPMQHAAPIMDPAPTPMYQPQAQAMPRQQMPAMTSQYRMQPQLQAQQASMGMGMGGGMGQPVPMAPHSPVGAPRYDSPNLPNYAWPGYAAHPNYAALTYPQQYSPTAWPYIGPFYPYPQVPLGWRKVSLEWDDGWWFLDFTDR